MPKKKLNLDAPDEQEESNVPVSENPEVVSCADSPPPEQPPGPQDEAPAFADTDVAVPPPSGFPDELHLSDDYVSDAEILSLDMTPLEAEGDTSQDHELDAKYGQDFQPIQKQEDVAAIPMGASAPTPEAKQLRSNRQDFFGLDFRTLDRGLTTSERQEWNSIYASFRGRSAITGTIIGVDRHTVNVRDPANGEQRQEEMYCAIIVPYRVRIVIPATEMWDDGMERPSYVMQNMVGARIDCIIIMVDREAGFALASRKLALRARRFYFSRRPALHKPGAMLKCQVLAVGPRRCLVECIGHDIDLTQRELRYSAIPDLRNEYHPGQELDCIVKQYEHDPVTLTISVKETIPNPFDGASERHPVGCRRQAVISGKYGGGVFCNLPDGTVCMCSYSYQYDDADFSIGDKVIAVIQHYDMPKKQIYGKILSKW